MSLGRKTACDKDHAHSKISPLLLPRLRVSAAAGETAGSVRSPVQSSPRDLEISFPYHDRRQVSWLTVPNIAAFPITQ